MSTFPEKLPDEITGVPHSSDIPSYIGSLWNARYTADSITITRGTITPDDDTGRNLKIVPIMVETIEQMRAYQLGQSVMKWLRMVAEKEVEA